MQINLSHRQLKYKKPARTSRGEYTVHDMIVITITDEKGTRIGLGECAPLPDLSCDRDAYLRMSDVAALINKAVESEDYSEFLRPYPALLFALETAMCDYRQSPLLYDTPFAHGKVGIPINGLIWMDSYDNMLEQVKSKLKQGFRCIKIKIGAIEWDEEIRLIRRIRDRFSKDTVELRVDANCAFSPDEVLPKLETLAQLDVHSIEQPIKTGHWNVLADLCSRTPLPIALDEELIGLNQLHEKKALLDTVKPQYIVVKPSLHGGISGSLEWINEARKRGIDSWITSALESNIGLQTIALLAARAYGDDIKFPQGLGTGQLFVDNIPMVVEQVGPKIWMKWS